MKKADAKVLREVQKNARMATKALDALAGKIYDDDFALLLARQSLWYAEIGNRAADKLLSGHAEQYRDNVIEDMMLIGGIHTNTLFNTSTSHIAEMAIMGSSRGVSQLRRVMNAVQNAQENGEHIARQKAGSFAVEMAKELMDFEEKNIEQLKKYL